MRSRISGVHHHRGVAGVDGVETGQVITGPNYARMIAGTQMAKILSIVGSRRTLVTGGVP